MRTRFVTSFRSEYQTLGLILLNGLFLWWFFTFSRENLNSPDMFENYVWGMVWSLGNNKHPPFFGWITAVWFDLFPTKAWSGYLLSVINLLTALLFLRKVMLEFISEEKIFVALSLTIVTLSLGLRKGWEYNANLAQLPFLAGYMWALVKAYKLDNRKYIAIAGLFAAASILCKYSAVLMLASITISVWLFFRPQIKTVIRYLTLECLIILFILTPHIIWEFQHHFPAIAYMQGKHIFEADHSLADTVGERLVASINFAVISILMFSLALLHQTKSIRIKLGQINTRTIGFNIFILSTTFIFLGSIIEGLRPDLGWFIVGTLFVGWGLVDLLPININWFHFKRDITFLLGIYFSCAASYVLYHREQMKSHEMVIEAVPEAVSKEITRNFHDRYHESINYVGGTFPFAYALAFYSEDHPYSIFNLDLSSSPWIDRNQFLSSNKVIICGSQRHLAPIEPNCSQEAIGKFGIPNNIAHLRYQVFDPNSKSQPTLEFKVLMYK